MEPVITLSPSTQCYHLQSTGSPRNVEAFETTPKLPRRDRLASFSRLIASESFLEFQPNRPDDVRRQRFRKRNLESEKPTLIQVTSSSPLKSKQTSPLMQAEKCRLFDSYQLPFSPSFLNRKTPTYLSPNYKQPTPTKSPLYKSDGRCSSFLGRGSFGNVTLCIYKGSEFALKITRDSSFIGERNFIGIRHPHLVTILHISQALDKTFICMEFAGHCNLQQILDTKSELDFPRRLSFCLQILSGIRHCHQHCIVHADIKPANVIVSPFGICKLGDFGHSIKTNSVLQGPTDHVGTIAYSAPEVLKGNLPTLESDMYSFGILLWQVYTRELPFSGEHPHVILYKVAHYGARPIFFNDSNKFIQMYMDVTKLCWHSCPNERLTAQQAYEMLQEIRLK